MLEAVATELDILEAETRSGQFLASAFNSLELSLQFIRFVI